MITKKASLPNLLKNVYLTKKEPVSIVHFITNRCNARCSFCFIDFDNPSAIFAPPTPPERANISVSFEKVFI